MFQWRIAYHLHKYTICCHIAHNNEIFIILTRDFRKEQYVLPEDDMRYAIETCRSMNLLLLPTDARNVKKRRLIKTF